MAVVVDVPSVTITAAVTEGDVDDMVAVVATAGAVVSIWGDIDNAEVDSAEEDAESEPVVVASCCSWFVLSSSVEPVVNLGHTVSKSEQQFAKIKHAWSH